MRKFFTVIFVVGLLFSAVACAPKPEVRDRIGVVVTVLPQAEFVENVGREKVDVTVMVPPGANPHTYEPMPSQMEALAKAKMYAKVGAGIEFELVWMDKLTAINKDMLVVDCSEGVKLSKMAMDDDHHDRMDPHIWMSPVNAQIMVRNICDGLIQIDPKNKSYYQQNRDAYLQKLSQLDAEIRSQLAEVTNRMVMVYHPAFGYFASEYNPVSYTHLTLPTKA